MKDTTAKEAGICKAYRFCTTHDSDYLIIAETKNRNGIAITIEEIAGTVKRVCLSKQQWACLCDLHGELDIKSPVGEER